MIYACVLNNKLARSPNCVKLFAYFDLFKAAFAAFMRTPPVQREKLDSVQLNQMVTILLYMLTLPVHKSTANNAQMAQNVACELFVFFIEQFVAFYKEMDDLVLPALNLALSFVEFHADTQKRVWRHKAELSRATVNMLNDLFSESNSQLEKLATETGSSASGGELTVKFSKTRYVFQETA